MRLTSCSTLSELYQETSKVDRMALLASLRQEQQAKQQAIKSRYG